MTLLNLRLLKLLEALPSFLFISRKPSLFFDHPSRRFKEIIRLGFSKTHTQNFGQNRCHLLTMKLKLKMAYDISDDQTLIDIFSAAIKIHGRKFGLESKQFINDLPKSLQILHRRRLKIFSDISCSKVVFQHHRPLIFEQLLPIVLDFWALHAARPKN